MKVYDCFTFFNELDLLEIRLHELNNVVDYFVLVEATYTHQNNSKPLYFEENKQRYSQFLHKIIHIVVNDKPNGFNPERDKKWVLEMHQKRGINKILNSLEEDDIIICSDVDEIPSPYAIKRHLVDAQNHLCVFGLNNFIYYVDCRLGYEKWSFRYFKIVFLSFFSTFYLKKRWRIKYWLGPFMKSKKDCTDIHIWRDNKENLLNDNVIIPNAGWHFSYLGGIQAIINKLNALNVEFDYSQYKDPEYIQNRIKSKKGIFEFQKNVSVMKKKEYLPTYLKNNMLRYRHLFFAN